MLVIREMSEPDVEAILAIQRSSREAAQWSEGDYRTLAGDPNVLTLVAEIDAPARQLAGFAVLARLSDEAELRNLAVDSVYRRRGVAKTLLNEAHRSLVARGVKQVYLEVRESNEAAKALYSALGYELQSRRRDYYQNPAEDALVWRLTLPVEGC